MAVITAAAITAVVITAAAITAVVILAAATPMAVITAAAILAAATPMAAITAAVRSQNNQQNKQVASMKQPVFLYWQIKYKIL